MDGKNKRQKLNSESSGHSPSKKSKKKLNKEKRHKGDKDARKIYKSAKEVLNEPDTDDDFVSDDRVRDSAAPPTPPPLPPNPAPPLPRDPPSSVPSAPSAPLPSHASSDNAESSTPSDGCGALVPSDVVNPGGDATDVFKIPSIEGLEDRYDAIEEARTANLALRINGPNFLHIVITIQ